MKLYVIENDDGEWWSNYVRRFTSNDQATLYRGKDAADYDISELGSSMCHAVELVEAPEKVVVSEEEAKMLERAKDSCWPAHIFDCGAAGATINSQDRLMRAYVNGWTVEKPKLFLVKVPHTDDSYFYKIDDEYCNAGDSYHLEGMTDKKWFTLAEIEHYRLGDCQKVVCADSARTTGEVTDDDDNDQ